MVDQFLIIGLVTTILLSLIVFLVLNLLNKKNGKKTNFFVILLAFLFVFGLVYGIKINEIFRVTCGVLLLSIPATGILYFLRVSDKKVDRGIKNFIKIYSGMALVVYGAIIMIMLFQYNKDLSYIKNDTKPLYAEEGSMFTTNNNTCGSTFFEGLGYRVEYCSKYVNKNSYRIKLWVDPNWVYQSNEENIDDSNWCNCEKEIVEEDEKDNKEKEEKVEKVEEKTEEKEKEVLDKEVDKSLEQEQPTEKQEENTETVVEENASSEEQTTQETTEETPQEIIE